MSACLAAGERAKAAEKDMRTDDLFAQALEANGGAYVALEQRLAADVGTGGAQAIEIHKADLDPVARLLALVLLQWATPLAQDFEAALKYFKEHPIWTATTPKGTPSPSGVESYLSLHFKAKLTKLLALRMIKQPDWPPWQVGAVLLYLQKQLDPDTTGILLRFAIETDHQDWRDVAIETLKSMKDPAFNSKLDFEINRAKTLKRTVPKAVTALRRKLNP